MDYTDTQPELLRFTRDLALHLEEATGLQWEPQPQYRWNTRLTADPYELSLHTEADPFTRAKTVRLRITGMLPHARDGWQPYSIKYPSITISAGRPLGHIARDIDRRLWQDYRQHHAEVSAAIELHHADLDRRAHAKELLRELAGARTSTSFQDSIFGNGWRAQLSQDGRSIQCLSVAKSIDLESAVDILRLLEEAAD